MEGRGGICIPLELAATFSDRQRAEQAADSLSPSEVNCTDITLRGHNPSFQTCIASHGLVIATPMEAP